ncbi:two-component system osmolarity sensor histidine kinase EnvZ [Rhodovulum bhavnagarense]|uniref:histidine kinase n=2 Tax=Rhodovulum bhavnagarense TaxID=992286 RepID=A0A4V2SVT8_9RHOB|nr:two-component system osmolarity sensor histidine kinase EnvZ [Rhodovulum bhavnagarense]
MLPRGLYGRAALILLVPVIALQLVVSVVFIQRHFEDVTRQMILSMSPGLNHLHATAQAAPDTVRARAALEALGRALAIETELPGQPQPSGGKRLFYDLSGRVVVEALYDLVPAMTGVDLATNDRFVRLSMATRHGVLEVVFDRKRVSAAKPHQLLVLMVLTGLLMTLIAYLFLRNQLKPIKRLAAAAEAFGKGRIVPYRPSGATEVRAAGRAFVDMRDRIERQIEQRTMMLSGVSHDLRTPLTRLRLELAMTEDCAEAEAMLSDLSQMERMIDTFLDFARAEALDDPAPCDPADLVRDAAARARAQGGRIIIGPLSGGEVTTLRPLALERALQNLVGNAMRHGTQVRLGLEWRPRHLVFTVEDDGPGIPEARREEAMQPFHRLDAARNQDLGTGVGLGLAIAADIARGHGGELRLGQSPTLGGLRAELAVAR